MKTTTFLLTVLLQSACAAGLLHAQTQPITGDDQQWSESDKALLRVFHAPTTVSAEVRLTDGDASSGLHFVQPLVGGKHGLLLAEAYGHKGESELGLAGGGAIYRNETRGGATFELNAFFEGLRAEDGFSYPQLGVGTSYGWQWVTVRANGYLPLRNGDERPVAIRDYTTLSATRFTDWSVNTFQHRSAMRGFDTEMEFGLPKLPRGITPRAALGYYYRADQDREKVYSGLTARAEVRFARYWIAEAAWRNDASRIEQEWRVGLRAEFPLGRAGNEKSSTQSAIPALYRPAQRSPWPTVSRFEKAGTPTNRGSSLIAEDEDDCGCADEPLIFN